MARRLHARIGLILFVGLMVCVAGGLAVWWPVDTPLLGLGEPPPAATLPGAADAGDSEALVGRQVSEAAAAGVLAARPDRDATVAAQRAAAHGEPARQLSVPRPPAGTDGELMADKAAELAAAGKSVEARQFFVLAERAGLPPARQDEVQERLLQLAQETVLSSKVLSGDPLVGTHTVQAGDRLSRVARRHHVTAELLARINNLSSPDKIRVGQHFKVVHGPFRHEIVMHSHEIDVYLQDTLVQRFPVGLGADGSTPLGEWTISNKLVDPTYYAPDGSGEVIAPDDPENPLGERWLGFNGVAGEAMGQESYGIHGTIEPETIGQDASKGCIRMLNEDVEVLYDLLIEGSDVVIFP